MERQRVDGHTVWKARHGTAEVRFIGKGSGTERGALLRKMEPEAPPFAWAKQIHSGRHLPGSPGFCGEGDALVTERSGLALSVITADCVPVLVVGKTQLAAIHAGWRGIVADVVGNTLEALGEDPKDLRAWIGPSIGSCCYEVGPEVAEQVTAATLPSIAAPGPSGKPHLDLIAAVNEQLRRQRVDTVHTVDRCTRCHPEELASYRREGQGAGRNLAVVWRTPQ